MISSVLGILLAIAVWGAVHSWLASLRVREAVRRSFGGRGRRAYRFLYNVVSGITFAPILLLVWLLPNHILYRVWPPLEFALLGGQLLALLGLMIAIRQTDVWGFVGLKQLMGHEESSAFITGGLYRYMRHPMYFFGLLIIWLTPVMTVNGLVACIGLTAYVLMGAYFEEKKLSRIFGKAYDEYKSHTPMIIPFLVFRRKSA